MGTKMNTIQEVKPSAMVTRRRIVACAPNRPEPVPYQPSHEVIARRAYEIWRRHGCPPDSSFHNWLAAEAELRCPPHAKAVAHRYWNVQTSKHDPREL